MSLTKINVNSTVLPEPKLTFTVLLLLSATPKHCYLNFGQTQPIKVYSPRKLIFNVYSPPTSLVIYNKYNLVILQSQIRSSYKVKFGHLNNPPQKRCFFLLSALLRELGSLCWDRGYGAFESTLDAALLGSPRAGTDQTHVAGVVKLH